MKKNYIFFRNDDVRDTLDESLVKLTNLFIKHEVPISHAVEPANLTPEVINWLKELKNKYPHLIEIMQHGFDHQHKIDGPLKGEFGGERGFQEQYDDLKKGMDLLDQYFGNLWFRAFTFPFGPYNQASIDALDKCGFKVFSSHFRRQLNRRMFYLIGHILNKGKLFDKRISWNLRKHPGTNMFEIDMNISFIKKYLDDQTGSVMHSLDFMTEETKKYTKFNTIGILLHHRYHNSDDKLDLVDNYLAWVRKQNFVFSTLEEIYNVFGKKN